MNATILLASLHHLAAFSVVALLAIEVATFRPPFTLPQAMRLQRVDLLFGLSALVLLIVGLMRVTWFEKGPAYYWHDLFFLIKFGAFLIAALISIYPTVVMQSWNRSLRGGAAPQVSEACRARVRLCLMCELTAIAVILPCAALMARGAGFLR